MKNVKVILENSKALEQLKTIFAPLEMEIIKLPLDHRVSDEDFSETSLIIMDPHLGDKGVLFGIIDTLKSRSATSRIPILLCATIANDEAIVEGLSSGATDFIILPASTRSLQARIKTILNLQ